MAASGKLRLAILGLAPLFILALIIAGYLFAGSGIVGFLGSSNLPVENVVIERITLDGGQLTAYVVNVGPGNVTIAQVFVNDAIWYGEFEPSATIPRLGRAVVRIPYMWVEGEPVKVTLVSSNGFTFSGEVEAATLTPKPSLGLFWAFAGLGTFVGVVPVFLGLAWFPFLAQLKARWYNFLLSLTVGILLFLAIDAFGEAVEISSRVPSPFQGVGVLALGLLLSFLGLEMLGERRLHSGGAKKTAALGLAYLVALGIGLHNLGEGLSIGAAYAIGAVSLGTFLVLGFTIHNVTEGLAIVAPIAGGNKNPVKIHLIRLGLLAGAPTILGTWIGGFTYSDFWAVLFLGLGVGAILQVVYEIVLFMSERRGIVATMSNGTNLSGLAAGFLIMYLTALLVA